MTEHQFEAATVALIELMLITEAGAGVMDASERALVVRSVLHPKAELTPFWQATARSQGYVLEPEARPCAHHTWDNADLVGRCTWCGRPLPEEPT